MKQFKLLGKTWALQGFLPGEQMNSLEAFAVEKEILKTKTAFQDVAIIENKEFGRIFFINGFVQLATNHEEVYHEMIVHPALLVHENPKRVLIIGGGDGGALREVLKHPVKEVTLVDIDKDIVKISKQYLPSVSAGAFDDSRTKIIINDGKKILPENPHSFDCIILDSNDPDGTMAGNLFSKEFFSLVDSALKPKGIFMMQSGLTTDAFSWEARKELREVFPFVWLHRAHVYYYMKEHTFSLGSRTNYQKVSLKKLKERFKKRKIQTKYYSPEIHWASSLLPLYLKRELK